MYILCRWVSKTGQEFTLGGPPAWTSRESRFVLGDTPWPVFVLVNRRLTAHFQNTLSSAVPYAAACFFSPSNSRASPGSGENMYQASYRKPARAWPSAKKCYTCCSTRLFLRNNHLYSSSIGIHLLPLRWNQTHSNIPKIHTPQGTEASWLLGTANAYHTRALTDGASRTKWGPRPREVFPVIIIDHPTPHLSSRAATNPA